MAIVGVNGLIAVGWHLDLFPRRDLKPTSSVAPVR